ncbi:hypothetical protein F4808DRAFT_398654 [Astrocystis sublimbata]|nr:hypothetical protein F4808DRAFT_398654 [Astrocystis sublimbata]
MPKRKKNTARAQQRAESKAQHQNALKNPPKSKSKSQKNAKTQTPKQPPSQEPSQPPATPPTLGTLFAALPPELRASIFACLLARPIKWSAPHSASCALRNAPHPWTKIRPSAETLRQTCALAHCGEEDSPRRWRRRTMAIYQDPWRSSWAPVVRNEFLCSRCWDRRCRGNELPRVDSLPCLCARERWKGLGVLLVCRAWYEEGAKVLYTRNTFAFATPAECVAFFDALQPRWSGLVSKVSLRNIKSDSSHCFGFSDGSSAEKTSNAPSDRGEVLPLLLREAWDRLRNLPALSELELDAWFLTHPSCVQVFRGEALRNLRKLVFTQSVLEWREDMLRNYVWPDEALREVIEGNEFSVDVARGIKGWREGWVEGHDRDDAGAVVREQKLFFARMKSRMERIVNEEEEVVCRKEVV